MARKVVRMAASCKACSRPDRQAIDEALASGESHRGLARRVGLSRDALARHHRSHVSPALVRVVRDRHAGTLADRIESVIGDVEDVLREAKASGAGGLVLQSVDRLERLLRLLGQLTGELKAEGPSTVVNILASPEIARLITILREEFGDQPERLAVVAERLRLTE